MSVRRLTVELLENRWLLNGDPVLSEVSVQIKGGWLQIIGDNGDNQVFVQRMGDMYSVSVGEGTKFKGTGQTELTFSVADVAKGIKADMKRGDDYLELIGGFAGDVSVKMGDGSDGVFFGWGDTDLIGEAEDGSARPRITGKTSVDLGGKGEESWFMATDILFEKDVTIKSGNVRRGQEGATWIGLETCGINGKLTVTAGNTEDFVWLSGTTVTGDVTVKTGSGGGWISIYPDWDSDDFETQAAGGVNGTEYLIAGRLSVDVGHGWGGIWLEASVQKDVSLRAGNLSAAEEGDKGFVFVSDVDLGAKLTIKTGNGGWFVGLFNVDVAGDASITTGSGDDEILVDGTEDFWDESSGAGEAVNTSTRGFGGKLTINTGSGMDAVAVAMAPRLDKDLIIDTGNGNDVVALQQLAVTGNVSVKTGNGDDVIACAGVGANHVTLHSGNANRGGGDTVLFTNSIATVRGNLTITTGNGNDMVGVGKSDLIDQALLDLLDELPEDWEEYVPSETGEVSVLGQLIVNTGGGHDGLAIGNSTFGGSVSVDTGAGTDACVIESSSTGGRASIKMGSGDGDYLELGSFAVAGRLDVDGGAGREDELVLWGDSREPDVLKGFEILG
jgi:hypothetical protein